MTVGFNSPLTSANVNTAFASKTQDNTLSGEQTIENVVVLDKGGAEPVINDAQVAINQNATDIGTLEGRQVTASLGVQRDAGTDLTQDANFRLAIQTLVTSTTVDFEGDFVAFRDTSNLTNNKVLLKDLFIFQKNLTAVVDPNVNDDSDDGYSVGSLWVNATDGRVFIATDVTVGAAVWLGLNTPGGANGQIQYNDDDNFGGASRFYYNDVSEKLGLGITTPVRDIHIYENNASQIAAIRIESGPASDGDSALEIYRDGTRYGQVFSLDADDDFYVQANEGDLNLMTDSTVRAKLVEAAYRFLVGSNLTAIDEASIQARNTTGSNGVYAVSDTLANTEFARFRAIGGSRTSGIGVFKHAGITNPSAYTFLQSEDGTIYFIWMANDATFRYSTDENDIGTTGGTEIGGAGAGTPGGVDTQIQYNNAGVLDGANFTYNNANDSIALGDGTTSPQFLIQGTSTQTQYGLIQYAGASAPTNTFFMATARGTAGAPTATQTSDRLVRIEGRGYGTSFSGPRGYMDIVATEAWNATSNGCGFVFATTPNGTTAPVVRQVILNSGEVGIGRNDPFTKLHVVGGDGETGIGGGSIDAQTTAIIENDADCQLTILANNASRSQILFGDGDSEVVGRMAYAHGADRFEFWTAGAQRGILDSSGRLLVGTNQVQLEADVTLQTRVSSGQNVFSVASDSISDGQAPRIRVYGVHNASARSSFLGVYTHGGITNAASYLVLQEEDGASQNFWVDNTGDLRISTTLNHVGTLSGQVIGDQTSDERLKSNIQKTKMGLKEIRQIDVIEWERKVPGKENKTLERMSYSAQQLQKVHPRAVYETGEDRGDVENVLAVRPLEITALNTAAIQELDEENKQLKEKVATLENRIARLEGILLDGR